MDPGDGCDGSAAESCGNGRVDAGEECDDGNQDNTDVPDTCSMRCGDGVEREHPNDDERCDDGNDCRRLHEWSRSAVAATFKRALKSAMMETRSIKISAEPC